MIELKIKKLPNSDFEHLSKCNLIQDPIVIKQLEDKLNVAKKFPKKDCINWIYIERLKIQKKDGFVNSIVTLVKII